MLTRTLSFALLLLTLTTPALAGNGKPSQSPDAQAIDQACTAEAQTAGCGSQQVGTGLLKCLHAYKRQNRKNFTISSGCKAAMQKASQDRKAQKAGG